MVATQIRVIYGDTDQMGVVYYANYLRFFEAGRNEFIRAKGERYRDLEAELELRLPVVRAHVDYKSSARYDDLITVETSLGELRRVSARFDYRVLRRSTAGNEDELLATGHTVHACVDFAGKLKRMPQLLLARLTSGESMDTEKGQ